MSDAAKQRPSAAEKRVDGVDKKVHVISARWNPRVVKALTAKVEETVLGAGGQVMHHFVPGAYELPFAAQAVISQNWAAGNVSAVVCVGALIKGETAHFEHISAAVSKGLMDVQLKTGVPVVFGVLTCNTEAQALARAGLAPDAPGNHNHGEDWGWAALEMADYAPARKSKKPAE